MLDWELDIEGPIMWEMGRPRDITKVVILIIYRYIYNLFLMAQTLGHHSDFYPLFFLLYNLTWQYLYKKWVGKPNTINLENGTTWYFKVFWSTKIQGEAWKVTEVIRWGSSLLRELSITMSPWPESSSNTLGSMQFIMKED